MHGAAELTRFVCAQRYHVAEWLATSLLVGGLCTVQGLRLTIVDAFYWLVGYRTHVQSQSNQSATWLRYLLRGR